METSTFLGKLIVTIFIFASLFVGLWLTGRPLFMSKEIFERYLEKKTRLTRKIFPKYKPSIILNRIVYLLGFILSIVIFIVFTFVFLVSWFF